MPKETKKKKSMSSSSSTIVGGSGSKSQQQQSRQQHAPLGQVIQDDVNRSKYATRKISGVAFVRNIGGERDNEEEEDVELIDERTSRKILDLSLEQQREMMLLEEREETMKKMKQKKQQRSTSGLNTKKQLITHHDDEDSSDDDNDDSKDEEEEEEEEIMVEQDSSGYVDISSSINIGLSPEEEALLSNMMGTGNNNNSNDSTMMMNEGGPGEKSRNLADIIMAKIEEKEANMVHNSKKSQHGEDGEGEEEEIGMDLPPKVVQVRNHL